jgi:hypothetical protein
LVAADKIGSETVNYVSNIYKYYTAYKLLVQQNEERHKARESVTDLYHGERGRLMTWRKAGLIAIW